LFDLGGRKAMVVGGGGELGGAMAVALAEVGADVAIVDIDEDGMRKVAERIAATGREALALQCDVTVVTQVQETVRKIVSEFGALHIAVNSQGVGGATSTWEMSEELWNKVLTVNLSSVFYCAKYQGQAIRESGGGSIINMASMSARISNKGVPLAAYCSAKAGVVLLTKTLAWEWAPHNIRVNSLSPGYMDTKINKSLQDPNSQRYKDVVNAIPFKRMGRPGELKGAVVFLASDASSYMTGSDLVMDGGYTIW
jgi:NAD(P)-dependent dehydrogenase (short-subunit alcohol dehydrogenase family)